MALTWWDTFRAASNEIKDKKQLLDARKQIEREMERFKVRPNAVVSKEKL